MWELAARRGDLVFVALLSLGGLVGWSVHVVWRLRTRRRRWRTRTGGAVPRRAAGLEVGEVAMRGRLVAERGELVRSVAAGAKDDVAIVSSRPKRLTFVAESGAAVEMDGTVHLVGLGRRSRSRDAALVEELAPVERWPFDELPTEVREARSDTPVWVFGRLDRIAEEGGGYRDGASRLVLRPAAPSDAIYVSPRGVPRAWSGAIVGALAIFFALALASRGAERGYGLPGTVSFIVPWQRPWALRKLGEESQRIAESGSLSADGAALLLDLDLAAPGLVRARALRVAGRRREAIEEATRGIDDPFLRTPLLVDAGLADVAIAELRERPGPEARAVEVWTRLSVPEQRVSFGPSEAGALAVALDETCGDDPTCAAHPRLLLRGRWAPRERPSVDDLLNGRTTRRDPALAEVMLRAAGDGTTGDAVIARSRIRWILELAASQLELGAVDAARATLASARPSIERWPSTADLAREVDHFEAAATFFEGRFDGVVAHDGPCPLRRWLALPLQSRVGRPSRSLALALREARDPVMAFTPAGVLGVPWMAPTLEAWEAAELHERLLDGAPDRALHTSYDLARETSRARALRSLGDSDEAVAIETRVARTRRRLFGW